MTPYQAAGALFETHEEIDGDHDIARNVLLIQDRTGDVVLRVIIDHPTRGATSLHKTLTTDEAMAFSVALGVAAEQTTGNGMLDALDMWGDNNDQEVRN